MQTNAGEIDADLVRATLAGDREAFAQIVARYQSLICSLAYSATGSLSQSEDLAQDTFVAAWKSLSRLPEPEKLRAWLCGIARNLINNSLRRQKREPSHAAEILDQAAERPSPEPLPCARTISNEEQAILWRSLENIPQTYRVPLVLFYREHQSVEAVAEKLDLNPDTVHQRLSRGRKLLAKEVAAFVEGALAQTNPGQAFTLGVLGALPLTLGASAKAATVAAATKGGAMLKGTGLASQFLGILSGPLLGFLAGFYGFREEIKSGRTPRERSLVKGYGARILLCGTFFFLVCTLFAGQVSPRLWRHHPVLVLVLVWAMCLGWGGFVLVGSWSHKRRKSQLRVEERLLHPELFPDEVSSQEWEYRSRATLFGVPLVHWQSFGRVRRPGEKVRPAIGWIACGERAYGILYASGGVAVGGISSGGVSIGLISFGGCAIGLFAFGGIAFGALAMGGGAIGWIASGGLALGWYAAQGGIAAAHELACGGAVLGAHVNDAVAWGFFRKWFWLDLAHAGTRKLFWLLCFGPIALQMAVGAWWRRKIERRGI